MARPSRAITQTDRSTLEQFWNAWRQRWTALKEKCGLSSKAWTGFKTILRGRSTTTRDGAIPGYRLRRSCI